MKKVLLNITLVVILTAATLILIGCHGLGETSAERADYNGRNMSLDGSMMIDDIDTLLGVEQPSRLTEHTVR